MRIILTIICLCCCRYSFFDVDRTVTEAYSSKKEFRPHGRLVVVVLIAVTVIYSHLQPIIE